MYEESPLGHARGSVNEACDMNVRGEIRSDHNEEMQDRYRRRQTPNLVLIKAVPCRVLYIHYFKFDSILTKHENSF